MADWWRLTQGGSKVKHQCQSTIVGGAWVCVTSHSQESENGLIWERSYHLSGEKKHSVDFYHNRVVVYKHCQHTFMFKLHVEVNFASDDPFKTNQTWAGMQMSVHASPELLTSCRLISLAWKGSRWAAGAALILRVWQADARYPTKWADMLWGVITTAARGGVSLSSRPFEIWDLIGSQSSIPGADG